MTGRRANWKALFVASGTDPALMPMYLRWAVLLSLLLAFALPLYRLGYQSLWWDEAYSLYVSAKNLSDIAGTIDVHPPLYYWLLHFWLRLVGESELATRFLSLVFGVLIVALLYRLGLRLLSRGGGTLVAFLAACSPFLIAYSQETRMYTLETLLGLTSVYLLVILLMRQSSAEQTYRLPTGLLWCAYVLVTVLSLYTDYFPAATVVFQNLFVAAWAVYELTRGTARQSHSQNRRTWEETLQRIGSGRRPVLQFVLRWGFAQLAVLVLYLPWLSIAIRLVRDYGSGVVTAPSLPMALAHLFGAFNIGAPFRLHTFHLSAFAPNLGFVAAVLAIGLTLALLRKSKAEQERSYWREAFLYLYFLVPLVCFLIVIRFRPFFHPRYMLIALPPYLLLLALALNGLWHRWRVLAVFSLGGILVGSSVAVHSYYFDPAFAKDDARSTAHFLTEEVAEEDLILRGPNHPLEYYYRGVAPAEEIRASLNTSAKELERLIRDHQRVFWVTWDASTIDPWVMVPFLLEKNGEKVGERAFSGYNVQWYALSPKPSFSVGDLQTTNVNFGNKIALMGVAFGGESEEPQVVSGETCWVALRWKCLRELEDNLKFYVHIYDEYSKLVGQGDGFLFNADGLQTPHWKEGDVTYAFATPQIELGTPPGEYSIEVGVYVAETLERLSVGAVGRPDIVGSLQVLPPSIPLTSESLKIEWPLLAVFGEIELLGYEQEVSQVRQGDFFPVTLFWHAIQQPQHDLYAFIGLVDGEGAMAKEYRLPVIAGYPTSKWRSGETIHGQYSLLIPADLPGGEWRLEVSLAEDDMVIGEPAFLLPFRVMERQRSFVLPKAIQHPLTAELGHFATLLGYDVDKVELGAGDTLNLTLYWRARATADKRYIVFTHIIDEENHIWGQRDAMPQEGGAPTTSWLEGEVIVDTYQISIRPDCPVGEYRVEIGMYHLATGERLPVDGDDRLLLSTVQIIVSQEK